MKKGCPDCGPQVHRRRARAVRDRLALGLKDRHDGQAAIIYTVCTVPEHLREKFKDQKEWRAVVKKMWKVLRHYAGGQFGVECSHPTGDKEPGKFHPHCNFVWIQKKGFKPWLPVGELRRAWQQILMTYSPVDVYTTYVRPGKRNAPRIAHLCKYVTRFVDGDEWTGVQRWYGKYPKLEAEIKTCPKCRSTFIILRIITQSEYDLDQIALAAGP